MCHKKPRIWYICCKHLSVLSSIITYHRVYKQSNTTGSSGGAGTAYPFDLCSVLQIVVCPFVLFILVIVLSVLLRLTVSYYHLGIFKFFLYCFVRYVLPVVGFELPLSLVSYSNDSLRIMTEPFRPLGQTHYLKLQLH